MQELNLDVAGEFLVMAATLIHIKSQMLLPRPETGARRRAATRRIRATRWSAGCSSTRSSRPPPSCCTSARRCAARSGTRPDARVAEVAGDDYEPELEVDLFSLLAAFQRGARAREARGRRWCCRPSRCSIEERIEQLLERLSETEACGFEELFADVDDARRADRHVPGAARDDPAEADARVPVGQLRADPRLQARAAGRRAASDSRSRAGVRGASPGQGRATRHERRRTSDEGRRMSDTHDRRTRRERGLGGHADRAQRLRLTLLRSRTTGLVGIVEALIFASPEPITPKQLFKLLEREPKEDVLAALEELKRRLRAIRAGCSSSRSPAATRSSRGPSCTSGCGGCSTSARRRSCRCRRSRRWP